MDLEPALRLVAADLDGLGRLLVGHFPHYTHGEALAPVIRAFLDGLTDQGALTFSR